MTLTFNFKLMDYQELNVILSVSLGQIRRFLYRSKALIETDSFLRTVFENKIHNLETTIVFCVQSLCDLKFELRVRSKPTFFIYAG